MSMQKKWKWKLHYINPKGKFILSPQEQRQGTSVSSLIQRTISRNWHNNTVTLLINWFSNVESYSILLSQYLILSSEVFDRLISKAWLFYYQYSVKSWKYIFLQNEVSTAESIEANLVYTVDLWSLNHTFVFGYDVW